MPLFACSLVLITASAGTSTRREPKPEVEPEPKRIASIADEFFDSYLRWREACEDLRTAYERWGSCEPSQRIFRFEAYSAALEREERTARAHALRAEQLDAA